MGGVLAVVPLPRGSGAPKALQYKLEVNCSASWGCVAVRFQEVVVVAVSDILLGKRQMGGQNVSCDFGGGGNLP